MKLTVNGAKVEVLDRHARLGKRFTRTMPSRRVPDVQCSDGFMA